MGRKLDNWSFGLSLVGSIGGFLSLKMRSLYRGIDSIVLLTPWFLVVIGFILGIIALIKNPKKKWKPILAIIVSIIGFLLNTFLILMSGGGVGS